MPHDDLHRLGFIYAVDSSKLLPFASFFLVRTHLLITRVFCIRILNYHYCLSISRYPFFLFLPLSLSLSFISKSLFAVSELLKSHMLVRTAEAS